MKQGMFMSCFNPRSWKAWKGARLNKCTEFCTSMGMTLRCKKTEVSTTCFPLLSSKLSPSLLLSRLQAISRRHLTQLQVFSGPCFVSAHAIRVVSAPPFAHVCRRLNCERLLVTLGIYNTWMLICVVVYCTSWTPRAPFPCWAGFGSCSRFCRLTYFATIGQEYTNQPWTSSGLWTTVTMDRVSFHGKSNQAQPQQLQY